MLKVQRLRGEFQQYSPHERPNSERVKQNTMICNYCNRDQPTTEYYYKANGTLGGRKCKTCKRVEAKSAYDTKGGIEHLRAWRKANPERYKEQHQAMMAKRSARLKADPVYRDKLNTQKRDGSRRNFIVGMIARARTRAIKYDVPFSITVVDIVVPDMCPILEVPFVLGTRGDYQFSPSIDRIEPAKGYVAGNIKVISTLANTMKNSATKEQLMTFSRTITTYVQNMI